MKWQAVLTLFVLALSAGRADAQAVVVSQQAFTPTGSEQFLLKSTRLGRDFVVTVAPPGQAILPGMPPRDPREKLPAVYALDGGYGVVGPMAQFSATAGVTAPAYVVSISYPVGAGRRDTDLLFRPVTENGSTYGGGGAEFLVFLTDELRPFLEARFPLDPRRAVLFGHSFGGVFALNVLAERPDAFFGYIIGSASQRYDPRLVQRIAARTQQASGPRVFLAAGGRENAAVLDGMAPLAEALGPKVRLKVQTFEDENHLSYYPELTQAGLAWTIPSNAGGRVPTAISTADMDKLVGAYLMPDGRRTTIERRGDALFAQLTGLPGETMLMAETPRRFFVPGGYDVLLVFDGDASRRAGALLIQMGGQEMRAVRAD